jgi:hypothetical protein
LLVQAQLRLLSVLLPTQSLVRLLVLALLDQLPVVFLPHYKVLALSSQHCKAT